LHRPSESAAVLEDLVRLDPKQPQAYNELAYAYANLDDLPRALAADKYDALLPPNDPNAIDTRGDVYALTGQFDKAIAEYKKNADRIRFLISSGPRNSKLRWLTSTKASTPWRRRWPDPRMKKPAGPIEPLPPACSTTLPSAGARWSGPSPSTGKRGNSLGLRAQIWPKRNRGRPRKSISSSGSPRRRWPGLRGKPVPVLARFAALPTCC
jgi:hypothetical protein